MTTFLKISRRFPTTFRRFRRFSKIVLKERRTFPNIFLTFSEDYRRSPKTTEDFRGGTDDVLIIQQHIQVLFKGLCNHSNGDHFSNYGNANILTGER